MKILHVIQYIGPGGLEKLVYNLAKEQILNGHSVTVFTYDDIKSWEDRFRQADIHVISVQKKSGGLDFKIAKQLASLIKTHDIVHSHDLSPLLYTFIARLLSHLLTTKKHVHTTHGLSQIKGNRKNKLYEFICLFFCQKIVFVSSKDQQYYQSLFRVYSENFSTIPNGIPINNQLDHSSDFKQNFLSTHKQKSGSRVFVSVARVVPLKNHLQMVEAFDLADDTLLVIGPIDDQEYFQKIAPQENVIFLGARDDIDLYLSMADYFVSFSKTEGLPLSVIEAMSQKTPCLLSNIKGHQNFIENQKPLAYFFDLNKNHNFSDFDLTKDYTKPALQWTVKNYSIQMTYQRYLKEYLR